jgi:putative NIF3 family GTP cyclohydrolase 1 type 2
MTLTIQQVINRILEDIPGAPFDDTVDTFKTGDPMQPVTGIATTFLASCDVLQQAADAGANLVITHEPTFYNHRDETDWLENDAIYQAKRQLIDDNGLVVWRFHDYWHSHRPDGILTGVLQALAWESLYDSEQPYVVTIPAMPLRDLVGYIKDKLGANMVRVMGSADLSCQRVGLMIGAPPAKWQIGALAGDIDVLVTGEINEWETSEYVRDALYQGQDKALIIVGHELSEEPGMAYLVDWLRERFPDVAVTHIPTGDSFRFE